MVLFLAVVCPMCVVLGHAIYWILDSRKTAFGELVVSWNPEDGVWDCKASIPVGDYATLKKVTLIVKRK